MYWNFGKEKLRAVEGLLVRVGAWTIFYKGHPILWVVVDIPQPRALGFVIWA